MTQAQAHTGPSTPTPSPSAQSPHVVAAAEVTPERVLSFWLDELEMKDWYVSSPELDQRIRDTFLDAWEKSQEGAYSLWLTYPTGALAYIILNDQFSRNMFRDEGKAFSSDRAARQAAKAAIEKGWDLKIDAPARQFFYLPLMHSECLTDQERCVRLMKERMGAGSILHAKAHREVIRRFGRFPYRNAALARATTQAEQEFLDAGAYGSVVKEFETVSA